MIKREINTSCSSVIIDSSKTVYDSFRIKELKIKLFGLTIYSRKESFDCDKFINTDIQKSTGFKK